MMICRRHRPGLFALFLLVLLLSPGCGGGGDNPPPPPTSTTVAATEISLHAATLNGTVNPHAQATNEWFEWGTDNSLVNPAFTTVQAIGAGSADNSVSASISPLTSGTTYYYRVAATNASGTQKGAIASFTSASPNSPPSVTTDPATSVTVSGAVLNGTVSPNELGTTAVFEWGTNSNLTTFTSTTSQSLGAGTTSVAISASLSNLIPGTTYYFRVAATNSAGTSKGSIVSFLNVAQPPTVSTAAATTISTTGATLNGTVNPNGLGVSDAHFEYGTDSNLNTFSATSGQTLTAGFAGQPMSASLSGLIPGTTYYFRIVATNSAGTSKGSIVSFPTVAQPPTVATGAATSTSTTGATLNGTVNPNGLAVSNAHFEYGTDSTLTTFSATSGQTLTAGFAGQPITASLSNLIPGTTYYFRVAATNSAGTSKGLILSFSTVAQPPTVSTAAATSLSTTGATLNGTVNPNGQTTDGYFEWGTSPTLAVSNTTSNQPLGSGGTDQSIAAPLTSLISGTTYYYRVNATSTAGTSTGSILSFTTSSLGTGSFTYNSSGKNARVTTGDSSTVIFSKLIQATNYAGVFSLDFSPTAEYGSGGSITIRLLDTSDTYFQFSTKDSSVTKVRKGVVVDSAAFPFSYNQGTTYSIKITFSQLVTTFEAFGGTVSLTTNTSANPIVYFEVETTQQNAFYDNIKLETAPPLPGFFDDFSTDTTGTYSVF